MVLLKSIDDNNRVEAPFASSVISLAIPHATLRSTTQQQTHQLLKPHLSTILNAQTLTLKVEEPKAIVGTRSDYTAMSRWYSNTTIENNAVKRL